MQAEWPCKGDATHACSTGVRDFTLPCPEGFALRPDGESCEASPYTCMHSYHSLFACLFVCLFVCLSVCLLSLDTHCSVNIPAQIFCMYLHAYCRVHLLIIIRIVHLLIIIRIAIIIIIITIIIIIIICDFFAVPGSYSGMCPLVANFSGFSDAAKNSWSVR